MKVDIAGCSLGYRYLGFDQQEGAYSMDQQAEMYETCCFGHLLEDICVRFFIFWVFDVFFFFSMISLPRNLSPDHPKQIRVVERNHLWGAFGREVFR